MVILKKMIMKPTLSSLPSFGVNYSAPKLFEKIGKVAKKAGLKTVYGVLLLYYALNGGCLPLADKARVIGALGYFILPTDLIPDFLVGGFVDDWGALALVLYKIWDYITPETHALARRRLESWFGPVRDEDLKLF